LVASEKGRDYDPTQMNKRQERTRQEALV